MIDVERWQIAWNSVAALYTLQLTSDTLSDLPATRSISATESNSVFRHNLNQYEKIQDK
jgi:hypothetical protein